MPIEIGPDGTPIVTNAGTKPPDTPTGSGSDFTVGSESKGPTGTATEPISENKKPADAISTPKVENKPTGMDNKIEEAKAFNQKLTSPIMTPAQIAEQNLNTARVDKLSRIQNVLKEKGMDSQQQAQAMQRIAEILSD